MLPKNQKMWTVVSKDFPLLEDLLTVINCPLHKC